MADLMKQYIAMQKQLESRMPKVSTLKDIFHDYEKDELIEIAREKGISGALGKNKTQIIEKLYAFMMTDAEIRKYFYCMDTATRKEFQKASECKGYYESDTSGYLTKLYKGAYIGILEDGSVMIPDDVKNISLGLEPRREAILALDSARGSAASRPFEYALEGFPHLSVR